MEWGVARYLESLQSLLLSVTCCYKGCKDGITKKDVPSASLCSRDPSELKIPELK